MTGAEPIGTRGLILNVNLQGFGQRPAAWQVQDVAPDGLLTEAFWHHLGRTAERGLLDAVFFADHPAFGNPNPRPLGLFEPFAVAAAIAAATTHLGVVATASTTYNDPFELAERLAGLDALTGGRLGWNVVTTYSPAVSGNFGVDRNPDRPTRYRRAGEFVDLVRALWAGARTGRPTVHHGEFFDLEGRLDVPPSPQGEPILFQAGGSPAGRELAARIADGVFAVELTEHGAREHYELVKDRAVALGRHREDVAIVPGLSLVIGSTQREADALYDDLERRVPDSYALGALSGVLGVDASTLDPDRPIPQEVLDRTADPASYPTSLGYRETFHDWIRDHNDSVRGVLRNFGGYGARMLIGTPERIADDIEGWYRRGAADGFNIMLGRFPADLEIFVDEVVPLLQDRGVFRREYAETTLRARLGAPLPDPAVVA